MGITIYRAIYLELIDREYELSRVLYCSAACLEQVVASSFIAVYKFAERRGETTASLCKLYH